jgi:ketosteroid isomerase-like protein
MKKLFLTFSLSMISVIGFSQSNAEKAVEQAIETLRKAMVDGNRTSLENIAAAELSYGHSNGKIEDKAAFVQAIASGESDFVSIDIVDQSIKVVGKTAWARHNLTGNTNNGGKPGVLKIHVLMVWQKQGGSWKLLARQAVKI